MTVISEIALGLCWDFLQCGYIIRKRDNGMELESPYNSLWCVITFTDSTLTMTADNPDRIALQLSKESIIQLRPRRSAVCPIDPILYFDLNDPLSLENLKKEVCASLKVSG